MLSVVRRSSQSAVSHGDFRLSLEGCVKEFTKGNQSALAREQARSLVPMIGASTLIWIANLPGSPVTSELSLPQLAAIPSSRLGTSDIPVIKVITQPRVS